MINLKTASTAVCGLVALGMSAVSFAGQDDKVRVYIGFKDGQKAAVARSLKGAGAETHYSFDHINAFAVSVPAQALNGLSRNPNVAYVEEDAKRFLMSETSPYGIAMTQSNDSLLQTGSIGAPKTICIIDSGYDGGHEDLSHGSNVTGSDDPNGSGNWDFDDNSHGTHVAGTIAGLGGNGIGVVGVNPDPNRVNLHIVKVFTASGWAYSSSLVDAMLDCEANGANIISMSLGGSMKSRSEDRAFADSYARGVLNIAAAGNDGNTRMSYPASYDSVMSVAAIDSNMAIASFSQQNSQVEIAAPGVDVLSTVPMGYGSEANVSVSGMTYGGLAMEGSPAGDVTGTLVDCGLGESACTGAAGNVCLIQRGNVSFADKVLSCEAGGGVGAVIYNNEAGALSGTLGETVTSIPSIGVSDTDGATLLGEVGNSANVFIGTGNYAYFNGTSMATPHVSGIAGLVWNHFSNCSAADIRGALNATAIDLGDAGRDNAFGYGLVQARAAYDYLATNGCGGGTGGGGDTGGG
ncbi:MAG: S8 family serine peptidase, partial [Gammaproteobacteria bacterium]|nr:S8 family serine peptidase [Gammaproteobacteria bacterium]